MILAIDSSAGTAVAVTDEAGLALSSASTSDRRSHAEAIGPLIQQALDEAAVSPTDISTVVMGVGPGPFTGLRVGMAAAEAFAWGASLPVRPVRSHDVLAVDLDQERLVVSDARRGEWACTRYAPHPDGGPARVVTETFLLPKSELPDDAMTYQDAEVVFLSEVDPVMLAAVAQTRRGRGDTPIDPRPLYLRQPDVTMPQ